MASSSRASGCCSTARPASSDGNAVPGILDAPFVPTVTATTRDGAVSRSKTQLMPTGAQASFAAANAVTIEAEKSRVGTEDHMIGTINDGRVRRLPLVSTEAFDDSQVLVGDSRIGARLGVRQDIGLVRRTGTRRPHTQPRHDLVWARWTALAASHRVGARHARRRRVAAVHGGRGLVASRPTLVHCIRSR